MTWRITRFIYHRVPFKNDHQLAHTTKVSIYDTMGLKVTNCEKICYFTHFKSIAYQSSRSFQKNEEAYALHFLYDLTEKHFFHFIGSTTFILHYIQDFGWCPESLPAENCNIFPIFCSIVHCANYYRFFPDLNYV